MSCCGCASRVLKLQSEIRSWKSKLADERREKKMVMRWVMAVFGYELRVDIDKKTYGVRVQATENKDAVAKALIKLGIGSGDGELGVMIMELKLEKQDFYEPFEDPYEMPEFPILEINSMATQTLVSNGSALQSLGHLSQSHSGAPLMSIPLPTSMEISSGTSTNSVTGSGDQEVLYLASNFEETATLEDLNGQSYVIVKASSDGDDGPVHLDYSGIAKNETGNGNLYYRVAIPTTVETVNGVNYLYSNQNKRSQIQTHLSLPTVVTPRIRESEYEIAELVDADESDLSGITISSSTSLSPAAIKIPAKRKANDTYVPVKVPSQKSKPSLPKKKPALETTIQINAESIKSLSPSTNINDNHSNNISKTPQNPNPLAERLKCNTKKPEISTNKCATFQFGLTLREKAEIYVLQKAKEAIEKVNNGFRCTVCEDKRYTFTNYEMAMAHAKKHYEGKPYKCENCDELFAIQRDLLTHRKTVHPKPKGVFTSISSRLTMQSPSIVKTAKISSEPYKPTLTSRNNATSQSTLNPQERQIVVQTMPKQEPLEKNIIGVPISISSDVLAALFGQNHSTGTVSGTGSKSMIARSPGSVVAIKINEDNSNVRLEYPSFSQKNTKTE